MSGAQAESDIIVLCDAGCRYEPSWLEWMLRAFSDHGGRSSNPTERHFWVTSQHELLVGWVMARLGRVSSRGHEAPG